MNWSLIILGLVALSSVAIAENSYLVIVPKLLKVGFDNQLSVFIAAASQPVEVKFELTVGQKRFPCTTTVKPGETRNVTMTLPMDCPVGPAELSIIGTGGVRFEEKRDIIVYDNHHVVLVQTSASTYRPGDIMEVRVVATNEELIPIENSEVLIEIYDANLKLVGKYPNLFIRQGLTETLKFPISEHCNIGTWLISATIEKTTSSVEVLVAEPLSPSFDLKAIFQRFLLRTDKFLRGVIEVHNDDNQPTFGRCVIAVNPITEQDVEIMMKERKEEKPSSTSWINEEWRKWKSQQMEIAGRLEINYDLLSVFNIDVTKALAVQVYIHVTELASGQERLIKHVIPIFTRDVVYDIRPLEFESGIKNEFEIIAKRPDGKPTKMEDLIVTVTMMMGNEQGKVQEEKSIEIKEFYTRGRNDICFFSLEIPETCIGVLMTITPLSEDGKVRGYRTHAIPLMPTPRRDIKGAKLSIELLPSTNQDVNVPVVSSQISTVGRTSNFYVQVLPWKPIEKFEPLPMSYVILTNGRITLTGEFTLQPTKECQLKSPRSLKPEEQTPPICLYNGTLPIHITRNMMPYSTLLVYTFQPLFGYNVAESYRFSVAGLFPNTLTLNATIVPFTSTNSWDVSSESSESMEHHDSTEWTDRKPMPISERARDKKRIELSFTGTPDSTVGLNVIEYNAVTQGLSNEITKERLLHYLTMYEQVPIVGMPSTESSTHQRRRTGLDVDIEDELAAKRTIDQPTLIELKRAMEEFDTTTHFHEVDEDDKIEHKPKMPSMYKTVPSGETMKPRAVVSEESEERNMYRERMGYKVRYPIEKMIFGISSSRKLKPVEGDDVYTTPNMAHLYGEESMRRPLPLFRRRLMKPTSQYDVLVSENDYVVATSYPYGMKSNMESRPSMVSPNKFEKGQEDVEFMQPNETPELRTSYGTPSWYEKMHGKLRLISQEAFTFMQSGLTIVSDFPSLRIPSEMRRPVLSRLLTKYRERLPVFDPKSFDVRHEARLLLEEYLAETDLSMIPPPFLFEEQSRMSYYRSLFFNTSRIESQGVGKVVLPRTKPYSTWLATGFSLHPKSGLAVAQPIRLPTNQGLYIMCNFPDSVQIGEHALLTCGINNYLGKDLTNVLVRLRASADFDLIEQNQGERMTSNNGKDYTMTIPSLKSLGVETRYLTLVPKRAGVCKIVLEVESEFGGDYEFLTTHVLESGIERHDVSSRLFDLTSEKKTFGPIVEKITPSPFLRSVYLTVSGTGLDYLLKRWSSSFNSLIGIDRAIVRLWRLLGLCRYLTETSKMESPLYDATVKNITKSYQKLQHYVDYDGSYSFISDQGERISSLYLTSMAFGTLISPFMPVRDNVTIDRTLTWILSRQREDGSFDDEGPCFHYRFCSGEFRRESLTALVLYTMTHNNVTEFLPEFVRHRLYDGERSPILRAQRFLESRLDVIKPCWLTTTFVELALVQCRLTPEPLKQKIFQDVRSRQLTVVPEDGSRYLKYNNEKMTHDDQLLLNALTLSVYAYYGDFKTTSDIARWMVEQLETRQHFDTVLDAIFHTEAWIMTDCLFRKRFGSEKFSIVVDVTTDSGLKHQFKIESSNMDITQKLYLPLPVNQVTYTVSGFGFCSVCVKQMYWEKQQQTTEPVPFQLTNEFLPMPWLSEIRPRTCLTYTPTVKDKELAKETFNRTVVVEVQIPSGMRLNVRQIGFLLSRVPEVMWFTISEHDNKINFFLNIPSTVYGKQICFEWCLERLSFIKSWQPIKIRAYDYLQPRWQLVRLMPIKFEPSVLGYSYVDAVLKVRPTPEQLNKMQPPIRN